ncbi:UNVERIFIED_CONTAM: hypothetical protein Sangu_0888600 [Sesamum angustifolium]|uniref:Uncharacterized protein n=1 Tax=Sesamum angustifolium TaxID=2727405 RepID=A0AAW2PCV4_9LAMI
MASLVLLLSELLRHENLLDNLISSASPSAATAAPPSPPTKTAAGGTAAESLLTKCKSYGPDQVQEEVGCVRVDFVWP